jgi:hypothetical protein
MAGTRNKQMYSDFCIQRKEVEKQSTLHIENTFVAPAYPCGVNVQYAPSNRLSSNAVDLETNLFGIGSNNYVYPTSTPTPSFTSLSTAMFVPPATVYIPKLPPYLQGQRP